MRSRLSILAVLAGLIALMGCTGTSSPVTPVNPAQDESARTIQWSPGQTPEITLVNSQNIPMGVVTITNDSDHIFVNFESMGGWYLSETNVHMGVSPETMPMNHMGQPDFDMYKYGHMHSPDTHQYMYELSMSEMMGMDEMTFGLHALFHFGN
jgi:hypothetical protein